MKCLIVVLMLINISLAKKYQRCELAKELNEKHDIAIKNVGMFVCVAEVRSSLNTEAVNSGLYYGLYQVNSEFWCSQTDESGGGCKVKCIDFADDDITDDIKCAKQITSEQGFDAWGLSEACQLTSRNITKECFGIEFDSIVDESTLVLGNTALMNEKETVEPTDASDVTYFERESNVDNSAIKQAMNSMEKTNANTMIESTERSLIDSSITPSFESSVTQSTTDFVQKPLEIEQNKTFTENTINQDLKNSSITEGVVEMSESYVKMVKSNQENSSQKSDVISNPDDFTWEKDVDESSSTEINQTTEMSEKESSSVQSKTYPDSFSWEQNVNSTNGLDTAEQNSTENIQTSQSTSSEKPPVQSKTYPDSFSWEQNVNSTNGLNTAEQNSTETSQGTASEKPPVQSKTYPDSFSWEQNVNSTNGLDTAEQNSTVTSQGTDPEKSSVQSKTYPESFLQKNNDNLSDPEKSIQDSKNTKSESEGIESTLSDQIVISTEQKQTKTYPESENSEIMSENSVTENVGSASSYITVESSTEQKQTKTYIESYREQLVNSTLSESSANESTASYVTEQETTSENFIEPSTVRTYVLISRGPTNNYEIESTTAKNVLEEIKDTSKSSLFIDEPEMKAEPLDFVRGNFREQKGISKEETLNKVENISETTEATLFSTNIPAKQETFEYVKESSQSLDDQVTEQQIQLQTSTSRSYVLISRTTESSDEPKTTTVESSSLGMTTLKPETFEFVRENSRSPVNLGTEQDTILMYNFDPTTIKNYVLISRGTTNSENVESTSIGNVLSDSDSSSNSWISDDVPLKQETFEFIKESSRTPKAIQTEQNNINEGLRTLSESAHSENSTVSSNNSESSTEKENESISTTVISPVEEFVDLVDDKIRSIKLLNVGESLTLEVENEVTTIMMTTQDTTLASASTASSTEPSIELQTEPTKELSIKMTETTPAVSSSATTSTSQTESSIILKVLEGSDSSKSKSLTSSETESTSTVTSENLTTTESSSTTESSTATNSLSATESSKILTTLDNQMIPSTEVTKTTHVTNGLIESDFGRLSTKKMQENVLTTKGLIASTTPASEERISVKVIYDETVSYSTSTSAKSKETTEEVTTDSATVRSTESFSETSTKPVQNENIFNNKLQEEIKKSYQTNLENQMKQITRQQKTNSLEMKSDSKMFQPIIYNFFTFNFNGNGTNEMPMLDFKQFPFTNTIKMENNDQKMEITQHFPMMESEKEA